MLSVGVIQRLDGKRIALKLEGYVTGLNRTMASAKLLEYL